MRLELPLYGIKKTLKSMDICRYDRQNKVIEKNFQDRERASYLFP